MSEETFVRELERRADDVQPRHLGFEDVRASAYRIRRRRRIAASRRGAAAAVAAAVLLPTALLGGSPSSDRPGAGARPADHHAGPDRAIRPRRARRVRRRGCSTSARRTSVAINGDGEHDLPERDHSRWCRTATATSPWQSATTRRRRECGSSGSTRTFEEVEDLGARGPADRGVPPTAAGSAWMEVAPKGRRSWWWPRTARSSSGCRVPEGNIGYPVGFTAAGTRLQHRDAGRGTRDVGRWRSGTSDAACRTSATCRTPRRSAT